MVDCRCCWRSPGTMRPKSRVMNQLSDLPTVSRTQPTDRGGRVASAVPGNDAAFTVSAPKLELPKGGGAIRGIGEKFAANPVTGTGSMTVPIATSPGRSGFGPQLSLSLRLRRGQRSVRLRLALCRCLRSRARPTRACRSTTTPSESDVFILSGAEDLVPVLDAGRQPVRRRRTTAAATSSTATARASKGCSRASSAGRASAMATCIGARSLEGQHPHALRQGRELAHRRSRRCRTHLQAG